MNNLIYLGILLLSTCSALNLQAATARWSWPTQYTDLSTLDVSDIDKAVIRAVCDGNAAVQFESPAPASTFDFPSSIVGDCVFDIRVVMNSGTQSAWSAPVSATIPDTRLPSSITDLIINL